MGAPLVLWGTTPSHACSWPWGCGSESVHERRVVYVFLKTRAFLAKSFRERLSVKPKFKFGRAARLWSNKSSIAHVVRVYGMKACPRALCRGGWCPLQAVVRASRTSGLARRSASSSCSRPCAPSSALTRFAVFLEIVRREISLSVKARTRRLSTPPPSPARERVARYAEAS